MLKDLKLFVTFVLTILVGNLSANQGFVVNSQKILRISCLDTEAPIEDAKKLEALLEDGALITLEGCTHYAYLEALQQVVNILKNFI